MGTSAACKNWPTATPRWPWSTSVCAARAAASGVLAGCRRCSDSLGLESAPIRIEGYDISNLGPEHIVASMVVFEGGAPKKSDYRKFSIRGQSGQDDFGAIHEAVARRFARKTDPDPEKRTIRRSRRSPI